MRVEKLREKNRILTPTYMVKDTSGTSDAETNLTTLSHRQLRTFNENKKQSIPSIEVGQYVWSGRVSQPDLYLEGGPKQGKQLSSQFYFQCSCFSK
jgi:hypothetical protein